MKKEMVSVSGCAKQVRKIQFLFSRDVKGAIMALLSPKTVNCLKFLEQGRLL